MGKRFVIITFFLVMVTAFELDGIIMAQSKQVVPTGSNIKSARADVKWTGPGTVKLFFNEQQCTSAQGHDQILNLHSNIPYVIKAEIAGTDYTYTDFVIFDEGTQVVVIDTANGRLEVTTPTKTIADLEKEMVLVPAGTFSIGCPNINGSPCDDWEKTNPTIILSSFYMGRYDVTQKQWQSIMGNNPAYFKNCDDCPVEMVSWADVQKFIKKINQFSGRHFRLATTAEWEYAARGADKSHGYRYAGSNDIDEVAWYYDNKGNGFSTHPVGQKPPNELGLYDMNGNVWQWTCDWYSEDYYSNLFNSPEPAVNPKVPEPPKSVPGTRDLRCHIVRGGAWSMAPAFVSNVMFYGLPGDNGANDLGFRLVEDL